MGLYWKELLEELIGVVTVWKVIMVLAFVVSSSNNNGLIWEIHSQSFIYP